MESANHRIVAGGQFVQLGIFQDKVALTHGALDLHNAVAHQTAQASFGLRPVDKFVDGFVEQTAEKQSGSWQPAHHFEARTPAALHVLDAFAIH